MYRVKISRRRQALRLAAMAVGVGLSASGGSWVRADNTFLGSTGNTWNSSNSALWSAGVPVTGQTVDLYKNAIISYAVASYVDYGEVQISAASKNGSPAYMEVALQSGSNLSTGGLYLGAGVTTNPGGGAGEIAQGSGATVTMDNPSTLSIDPSSSYALSTGGVLYGSSELIAGAFSENGGSNSLYANASLTDSGTYTLYNSGILAADVINNSSLFNQSSSSVVRGSSTVNTAFNNTGTYVYTGGTFTGMMNNNVNALVTVATSTIPFTQGIANSGQLNVNSTGFNSSSGTYAGVISGTGNMVFSGTGIVTLTGSSTFSGTTSITGGTLVLAGPVGMSSNNYGGSLQGNIYVGTAGTLQTNVASQIANNTTLTINGGTVNLGGQDESVGTLNLSSGQIQQATGVGLGVTSGQVNLLKGYASIAGGLRSSSNLTFNVSNNASLAVSNVISGYANASTGLVLTGGGTLSIYGSSNLSTIDVQNGILQISEGGFFNNSNTTTTLEASGTLSLLNQNLTVGNLAGTGQVALGTGVLTVSAGSTFSGTVTGTGSLLKTGPSAMVLTGADFSTGATTATAGVLTLASTLAGSAVTAVAGATVNLNGSLTNAPALTASGTINLGPNTGPAILNRATGALTISGGQINLAAASTSATRSVLVPASLMIAGSTDAWSGQLDLSNNDLVVPAGDLATLTNQVKSGFNPAAGGTWTGAGITSSAAAANSQHLTALGVIQNVNASSQPLYGSGTALGLFDGTKPGTSAVLIKYTYFGDANLDGKVDGSDYSRIDNGFLNKLTGWFNGDFNYDGSINGSDFTLMDNAFNTETAAMSTQVAAPTAEIAPVAAVPEPIGMSFLAIPALASLRRRRRHI